MGTTTSSTLSPGSAAQRVAAFIAQATQATFAAKVGGSTATPNALGRAVTGYMGHSRMFTNVRQAMRSAGYRANGTWPALTLAQWQAVYGVQPNLARTATAAQQAAARARVGRVLASASKATGAPLPRNVAPVLPPRSAHGTQGKAAQPAQPAQPASVPQGTPQGTPSA